MHANWKCQGDLGTCIRALGNSNSSKPRLAHSPFHAGWVSTFPGYPMSCLAMQQLPRESNPQGRIPAPPSTLGSCTQEQLSWAGAAAAQGQDSAVSHTPEPLGLTLSNCPSPNIHFYSDDLWKGVGTWVNCRSWITV